MRLPTQKRILREDVKDAPAWINAIIDPFNSFAETVYQALNQNITFSQNVACFIKELVYTTPSTYPVMDEVKFESSLKTKAVGVFLMQAVDRSNYTGVSVSGSVPWIESNGTIVISALPGLQASKSYSIRLLVV